MSLETLVAFKSSYAHRNGSVLSVTPKLSWESCTEQDCHARSAHVALLIHQDVFRMIFPSRVLPVTIHTNALEDSSTEETLLCVHLKLVINFKPSSAGQEAEVCYRRNDPSY